jgi:hypothetical protein
MSVTYIVVAEPGKLGSIEVNQQYVPWVAKVGGFKVAAGEEAREITLPVGSEFGNSFESVLATLNLSTYHSDKFHVVVDMGWSLKYLQRMFDEGRAVNQREVNFMNYIAGIVHEVGTTDLTISGFGFQAKVQVVTFDKGAAVFRSKFSAQLKSV